MQNVRLFLFATLGALVLLLWNAWQEDYGTTPPTGTTEQASAPSESAAPAPNRQKPERDTTGNPPATGAGRARAGAGDETSGQAADKAGTAVTVTTDLLEIEINTRGGGIESARMRKRYVSSEDHTPFPLLTTRSPLFVAEAGLVAENGPAPSHQAEWQAKRTDYRLSEGQDELVVPLTWTGADGVEITRRYVFHRNSYVVDLRNEVHNGGNAARRFYQYMQLRREHADSGQSFLGARSYTGGVIYTPADRYQKIDFEEIATGNLSRDVTNGWVAMIQHYFLAAFIPPRDVNERFYTRGDNGEYILGMSSPWREVSAGGETTLEGRLFVGPKEQDRLASVVTGLELTVDYGWFTILSKPLFVYLSWIHGVVGNWGWAIILLVLSLKIVFFKLSETSYRSMARMRKLQPKMQELKERHGDDKQRMNQEVMELYKREKVNPLGGCLPIVVQIPVFISLYWVLLESVELRQVPWILWIHDLSQPDPYFVLPLLMGLTMLLQQRLNPAPMDPIQQKVMMALPVVFTVFFLFFPAGLVMYWVTNNSLSILQQWFITRRIEAGHDKADKLAKGRKKKE